jgi:hypothetical protein
VSEVAESKVKSGAKGSSRNTPPVESPAAEEDFVLDLPADADKPKSAAEPFSIDNRLGEMIQEALNYALRQNLKPSLDRLAADFERRIQDARNKTLEDTQAQLETFFNSFKARIEIKGVDVLHENEQAMDKKAAESVEAMRQNLELQQQEAAQKFSDAIRVRLMQMVVAEEDRMRKEMADAVQSSVATLRENMVVELAKFTEQSRARGEEMAALAVKPVQQAENDLDERLKRFEEISTRLTGQLEQRAEQVLNDSIARMTRQMEEGTTRVHQSFMRHIVTELSGKQAKFVEEAMKPLEEAAEQNLRRMRKELARMVKEVGQRFVIATDGEE